MRTRSSRNQRPHHSRRIPFRRRPSEQLTVAQLKQIINHGLGESANPKEHGPNGLGGVPNPQSPDKAIPALSGAAFFKQFNTDKKIIDVIRSGSVIGRAPIVSMPHWGGIIPDSQLQALVAYIKTLKTG
jgi:hypothetical protein